MTVLASAQDATASYDCKVYGCPNTARANRGKFAYLCDQHIEEAREPNGNGKDTEPPRAPTPLPTRDRAKSIAEQLKALGKLAKNVDAAEARARRLTEQALAAKRDAETKRAEFRRVGRELLGEAIDE